jgi:aspartate ammonia-lyase
LTSSPDQVQIQCSEIVAREFPPHSRHDPEGCRIFADRCIAGLRVDADRSWKNLSQSFAVSTVFLEKLGYKRVVALVKQAQAEGVPLAEIAVRQGLMNAAGVTAVLEDAAQSVV